MREHLRFYVDGKWVVPRELRTLEVENPATETVSGRIALGAVGDVDLAVKAARRAFLSYSRTSRQERIDLLTRILAEYQKRAADLADAVTEEMGAPTSLSQQSQVPAGIAHLSTAIEVLKNYPFEECRGQTLIVKEPIGVCAFITPWNWPLNQITCKVAPAISVGCTMILKPSEIAPYSAQIFAEVMDAAGVPPGVFNLVYGDGPGVGTALSQHPDVDMVSFTGSTRAGIEVARNAALTVKRVHQELGGKSANIVLDDAAFDAGVARGVQHCMNNSGQSCNAPTRMLVPAARMKEAKRIAKRTAESISVGDPKGNSQLGPLVSKVQWDKVQSLIKKGIDEGATLVSGGLGRPEDQQIGHFVKPTVFADVTNDMSIAQEEIFGPVLSILGYDTVEDAIRIANDTPYGLAAYVQGLDLAQAGKVAAQLRAGQVAINGARDMSAPFGGYKQSGNGREWGDHAFHEFVEIKAVLGHAPGSG